MNFVLVSSFPQNNLHFPLLRNLKNILHIKYIYFFSKNFHEYIRRENLSNKMAQKWYGVKVGPVPWDLGPRNHGTQDLGPTSKFKSRTLGPPSKFKSATLGPPSKFKSTTLIIIFLHWLTYFVLDKYIYNMEMIFHK